MAKVYYVGNAARQKFVGVGHRTKAATRLLFSYQPPHYSNRNGGVIHRRISVLLSVSYDVLRSIWLTLLMFFKHFQCLSHTSGRSLPQPSTRLPTLPFGPSYPLPRVMSHVSIFTSTSLHILLSGSNTLNAGSSSTQNFHDAFRHRAIQ